MYAIAESWICGNPYKLYLSKAGVRLVAAIAVWEPKPPLWLQIWPAAITATRCDSVGQSPDGQKFLCPALHYFDISEILSHESLGDKICHCTNRSLKMAWEWKKKKRWRICQETGEACEKDAWKPSAQGDDSSFSFLLKCHQWTRWKAADAHWQRRCSSLFWAYIRDLWCWGAVMKKW